jgi:hypothetical protein
VWKTRQKEKIEHSKKLTRLPEEHWGRINRLVERFVDGPEDVRCNNDSAVKTPFSAEIANSAKWRVL